MGSIGFEIDRDANPRDEVMTYSRAVLRDGAQIVDHSFASTGGRAGSDWGQVMYAAVREESGDVWALMTLFSVGKINGRRALFVKLLDETEGLGLHTVPLRLLNKLTPTESEYAVRWRQAVRRFHLGRRAARSMVGKVIELDRPVRYGEPVGEVRTVTVQSLTRWQDVETGCVLSAPAEWWMSPYRAA